MQQLRGLPADMAGGANDKRPGGNGHDLFPSGFNLRLVSIMRPFRDVQEATFWDGVS